VPLKPTDLAIFLDGLIGHQIKLSTMIWGPPGIGKSSIVKQTAHTHGINFIDLRLSQLAPTDLRGLPVAENNVSRWYPPEFLPREGTGILFLDEINLAPPAMQGMAQQLILDRQVGNYSVPDQWFIWAAGNRKEDMAAVYDMPAPLANRFLHLDVEPDFDSFKQYALSHEIHERIIAFLAFRPALLHKSDAQQSAWPSPRSWEMANQLHKVGLNISPAVGHGVAAEFEAYTTLYTQVPDLERIAKGEGADIPFPAEPSLGYAVTTGLTTKSQNAQAGFYAFQWLAQKAAPEWVQLFAIDLFRLMRAKGEMKTLAQLISQDPHIEQFLMKYQEVLNL
jgi:MoxR-like ATPase